MKKQVLFAMLLVSGILAVFLLGFTLGRYSGGQSISVTQTVAQNTVEISTEVPAVIDPKPLLIDINTATLEELTSLPGIGTSTAQHILDYRREHGAFVSIYDLLQVSGIGEAKLNQIKNYIAIGG